MRFEMLLASPKEDDNRPVINVHPEGEILSRLVR